MSVPPPPALRCGFVALVGWTNVGKSTLLNRLVGTKLAAVADVAQTTRHRILGARSFPGRGQIVFVDTPGFHHPRHGMNRRMVAAARRCLAEADLALQVVDARSGLGPGDRRLCELLQRTGVARWLLPNKIDLVPKKTELLPLMREAVERWGFAEVVPLSGLTGEGCDRLLDLLLEQLPESDPPYPEEFLTDQSQRALAAEWIREKLLAETRQELPHAIAVQVERWNERADGLLEIEAAVLLERESQRKIVIGRQGALLKRVGTAARLELEELLGCRVYLRLWVHVRDDWRNDERVLDELGLG